MHPSKITPSLGRVHLLAEISAQLDKSRDLDLSIRPILEKIGDWYKGEARIAVSLYSHEAGQIVIKDSVGLTPKESRKGQYKKNEGVTGRVFTTGESVRLQKISDSDEFLARTMATTEFDLENSSFICVPIKIENEVIGALSVMRPIVELNRLEAEEQFLSIIASFVAGAADIRRITRREKKRQEERTKQTGAKNIIGRSKKMMEVYDQINQVSNSDATVLLLGESGVGKELVAHAIHYSSDRSKGPFVRVNCAALPESVLESELFGHEKGAFTGALRQRKGRFEQAQGGTLFLDEIGDFSPAIQVALLRFLQEREIERVGGNQTIKLDVRIIAATNRDLEAQMQEGDFRQDLYYRLNVFPIRIPALRERKDDIPLLVDFFIQKYRDKQHDVRRISMSAINALMTYSWPGNVRELENFIERAVLVARNQVIRAGDLPPTLATPGGTNTHTEGSLQQAMDDLEREMISDVLIEHHGNMAQCARVLGISERIMGLRVKKYGFNPKSYKSRS